MRVKRFLNTSEKLVYDRLRAACAGDGASVFPKVRVADVLDLPATTSSALSFALKAHFDFLVVDSEQQPLFALEFDGPHHASGIQQRRDQLKDDLCRDGDLPLLRVTARHLVMHRGMDLLTWIVDVWFTQQAFDRAQAEGLIPWEESFDPLTAMTVTNEKIEYPFWFSKPAHDAIRQMHKERIIVDPISSFAIGSPQDNTYRSIAWLRLPGGHAIYATAALQDHEFPVGMADALEQIVELELFEKLQQVQRGVCRPLPSGVVEAAIKRFQKEHHICRSSIIGAFGQ